MVLGTSLCSHIGSATKWAQVSDTPRIDSNLVKSKVHLTSTPLIKSHNAIPKLILLPAARASSPTLKCSTSSENQERLFWKHYFLNYSPKDVTGPYSTNEASHRHSDLKEEVGEILMKTLSHQSLPEQLQLLDTIQRLGIGYHFAEEIERAILQIYNTHCLDLKTDDNSCDLDIYHSSLKFRLLRQLGLNISSGIFKQFLDESGNFKASICSDVEGLLSLYEASYLRTWGDDILDKALNFTTAHLKVFLKSDLANDHFLAAHVAHALENPLHLGVQRLQARLFISFYEQHPERINTLLNFAKLDFNLLQLLHKQELADLMRWWSTQNLLERIPYNVREIMAEIYFCAFNCYGEAPQYSDARIRHSKWMSVGVVIDDFYDVCDIADLQLFTRALQRWEKGSADELPNFMKIVYLKVMETYEELFEKGLADKGLQNLIHVKDTFQALWPPHLVDTTWCYQKCTPPFKEYMTTVSPMVGQIHLTLISCLGIRDYPPEVLKWVVQYPKMVRLLCEMCRIWDDVAEDNPMESKPTRIPSVIACYMKEYKVTKKVAHKELLKMASDGWKDLNQCILEENDVPMSVLLLILNQTRCDYLLLRNGDGFTNSYQTPVKENLALLFKDPIPM